MKNIEQGREGAGGRQEGSRCMDPKYIGRAPHLPQLEVFHALLIWRDGREFYTDIVLENRLGRFYRYSIIRLGTGVWWICKDLRSVGRDADKNETEVKIFDIEL
jgi:hypothetical protein